MLIGRAAAKGIPLRMVAEEGCRTANKEWRGFFSFCRVGIAHRNELSIELGGGRDGCLSTPLHGASQKPLYLQRLQLFSGISEHVPVKEKVIPTRQSWFACGVAARRLMIRVTWIWTEEKHDTYPVLTS